MIDYEMLHHVSVSVVDLEACRTFYRDVLGLKEIERPPLDVPGVWFGIGPNGQQLHLIVHQGETLRQGPIDTRDGHLALRVSSYKQAKEWLDRCGVEYEARPRAKAGFPQIYVLDPDRNIVELNADILDME